MPKTYLTKCTVGCDYRTWGGRRDVPTHELLGRLQKTAETTAFSPSDLQLICASVIHDGSVPQLKQSSLSKQSFPPDTQVLSWCGCWDIDTHAGNAKELFHGKDFAVAEWEAAHPEIAAMLNAADGLCECLHRAGIPFSVWFTGGRGFRLAISDRRLLFKYTFAGKLPKAHTHAMDSALPEFVNAVCNGGGEGAAVWGALAEPEGGYGAFMDASPLGANKGLKSDLRAHHGTGYWPRLVPFDAETGKLDRSTVLTTQAHDPELFKTIVAYWTGVFTRMLPETQEAYDGMPCVDLSAAASGTTKRKRPTAKTKKKSKKKKARPRAADDGDGDDDDEDEFQCSQAAATAALVPWIRATWPCWRDAPMDVRCNGGVWAVDVESKACPHRSDIFGRVHAHAQPTNGHGPFFTPAGTVGIQCHASASSPHTNPSWRYPEAIRAVLYPKTSGLRSVDLADLAVRALDGCVFSALRSGAGGGYFYDARTALWSAADGGMWNGIVSLLMDLGVAHVQAHADKAARGDVEGLDVVAADAAHAGVDFGAKGVYADPAFRCRVCAQLFRADLAAQFDQPLAHELPLANGILDLKTLALRDITKADMLTRTLSTAWDAAADTSGFDTFLRQVVGLRLDASLCHHEADRAKGSDDEAAYQFLRVYLGLSTCTAHVAEELIGFFIGSGSNGKSTLLGMINDCFGHLAVAPERSILFKSRQQSEGSSSVHKTHLRGARWAAFEETDEDGDMDVTKFKSLTTGTLACREHHGKQEEIPVTWHFAVATNEPPSFGKPLDDATVRRLVCVPFPVKFLDANSWPHAYDPANADHRLADPSLLDRMRTPAFKAGMVRFLAEGARDYYRAGIPPVPDAFRALASTVLQANNPMAEFLQNECHADPAYQHARAQTYLETPRERRFETPLADFRARYTDWCHVQGDPNYCWNRTADRRALELAHDVRRLADPFQPAKRVPYVMGLRLGQPEPEPRDASNGNVHTLADYGRIDMS